MWKEILIGFLVWNFIGTFGISIGFHRLLTHKSFSCPVWFEKFCTYVGCLATAGSPLGWVGVHRMHHQRPDQPNDPHSPHKIGFWSAYCHLWGNDTEISWSVVKDIIRKPHIRFTHKRYMSILVVWATLLYSLGAVHGAAFYSIPSVFAFHAFGLVNATCHVSGYRNYDTKDQSRNNWLVNIFVCGEGWHNNHHQSPNYYRFGHKWYEWDFSARIIELLRFKRGKARPGKLASAQNQA